ncbi:MAG: hypothetical protein ACP5M9_01500 [Candidatus Micrarchaeia archaeon]
MPNQKQRKTNRDIQNKALDLDLISSLRRKSDKRAETKPGVFNLKHGNSILELS